MGMIGKALGLSRAATDIGAAATGLAEVFTPNATRAMTLGFEARNAAMSELASEFAAPSVGWFDRFVDGLNRLPRPGMALGTLGLFVYAMADPASFAERMQGLAYVPDPLWWLLGAIVSFYFGARELHHVRAGSGRTRTDRPEGPSRDSDDAGENAALGAWRAARGAPVTPR